MSKQNIDLIDECGLPPYFDIQAGLGKNKHIGGTLKVIIGPDPFARFFPIYGIADAGK